MLASTLYLIFLIIIKDFFSPDYTPIMWDCQGTKKDCDPKNDLSDLVKVTYTNPGF